jgi:DNA-binding winged helix-turn-helix (wHTH) protein/tetratricopeptide (TPR) repeat protein
MKRGYAFGSFVLDLDREVLERDGDEVAVPPKAYRVLRLFLERPGELVTKDELIAALWPDTFVEENNLNQQIATLRRVLGSGEHVRTVPRRGFRFVMEVVPLGRHEPAQPPAAGLVAAAPGPTASARTVGRFGLAFAVALLVVAAVAVAWRLDTAGPEASGAPDASIEIRSVAVLPLRSLDVNDPDGTLGTALADALTTRLGYVRGLGVRPTAAVLRYLADAESGGAGGTDASRAGRELRVDAVLDGSFRRSGDQTRITLQLVGVRDGLAHWSRQIDVGSADPFDLEDALAEQVALGLASRLAGDERARLTSPKRVAPEAHAAFLLGRHAWNRRTKDDLLRAVREFERAIALDPGYALAYAGLADAYNLRGDHRRGEAAALRALELDPDLAEAHAALGNVKLFFEWNLPEAERALRRAVALNPSYATAHHWLAYRYLAEGRFDEALASIERAGDLDPLSQILETDRGEVLYLAGRIEEAWTVLTGVLQRDPGFLPAWQVRAEIQLSRGRLREAIEEWSHVPGTSSVAIEPLPRDDSEATQRLRAMLVAAREKPAPEQLIPIGAYHRAVLHAALGERDEAIAELEQALAAREGRFVLVRVEPIFASLRGSPRFAALVEHAFSSG